MTYKQTQSILNMTDAEVYSRLYYFWCLVKARPQVEVQAMAITVFSRFCRRLKKTLLVSAVLESHIMHLVGAGKLHPVCAEDEEDTWHFKIGKKLSKKPRLHFYEDERISCDVDVSAADFEWEINVLRCTVVGEKGIFSQIIEQTFFTDELDVRRHIPVPARIKKAADSLGEAQFFAHHLPHGDYGRILQT